MEIPSRKKPEIPKQRGGTQVMALTLQFNIWFPGKRTFGVMGASSGGGASADMLLSNWFRSGSFSQQSFENFLHKSQQNSSTRVFVLDFRYKTKGLDREREWKAKHPPNQVPNRGASLSREVGEN